MTLEEKDKEELRKSEIRSHYMGLRDNFEDLHRHPAWKALEKRAHQEIEKLLESLKSPKVNLEEMRYTQGQIANNEAFLKYVDDNRNISDDLIEHMVEDQYLMEVSNVDENE